MYSPSNNAHAGLNKQIVYSKESDSNQPTFATARGSNCLQLPTNSYQTARRLSIPNFMAERSINAGLYKNKTPYKPTHLHEGKE